MSILPAAALRPFSPELSDSDELSSVSSVSPSLYCDEERFEFGEVSDSYAASRVPSSPSLLPSLDEDELRYLLSKEEATFAVDGHSAARRRRAAVEWIVRVTAHYGFSTLTAVSAIDHLDRFVSCRCYPLSGEQPWTIQLVAVACLSIAAKVEETDVPLLVDLQVEGTKYVFEAKTVQRMELLVLSALGWKMHRVTPISFVDRIVESDDDNNHLQLELLTRCHRLILSILPDSRSVRYRPSVLATAVMMHVTDQVGNFNSIDYQTQLLTVLNISKEEVKECYELIMEVVAESKARDGRRRKNKRKYSCVDEEEEDETPSSPSGVIDAFRCDCDSSSSVTSSPPPVETKKKGRTQGGGDEEEDNNDGQWVFVGFVGSHN